MPNPQHAILTNLTKYQWYTHLSRTEGADLGVIKQALADLRAAGAQVGVTTPVNVCILLGPTLLADLTERHSERLPGISGLRIAGRQGRESDPGGAADLDPL